MRSDVRKLVPQVVAALGVVLSLVFVGFEVRQNTKAVRGATLQAISDQAFDFAISLVQDDDWIRIITFLEQGGRLEELDPEDQTRFQWGAVASVRVMENRYRQVRLGVLDAAELEVGGGRSNTSWYHSQHFLDYWQSRDQNREWSSDFVEFMETEVLSLR